MEHTISLQHEQQAPVHGTQFVDEHACPLYHTPPLVAHAAAVRSAWQDPHPRQHAPHGGQFDAVHAWPLNQVPPLAEH